MKNNRLHAALAALIGLALVAQSAKAQNVSTSTGDLILAVYQTNSALQGYGDTYEVDLGSLTSFAPTVTNDNLSSRVNIADLTTIFGANLSSTSWDVVATSASNDFTNFPTSGKTVFTNAVLITSQSVPSVSGNSSHNALSNAAANIGGFVTSLNTQPVYDSGDVYAAEIAAAAPAQKSDNGAEWGLPTNNGQNLLTENAFGGVGNFYLIDPPADGPPGTTNGTVTPLGSFQFVSNTTFEYNYVATPEPSTDALLGLGALLLVCTLRRKASTL
jgi:hypothetical protein